MRLPVPVAFGLAIACTAQQAGARYIDVELIAESLQPKPGQSVLVGLRMVPKPGWHSYWSNPGDSGLPTEIRWIAPTGVRFGPLRHPAPSLLQVAGMTSYVHEGPQVLLAPMTLDRQIAPGTPLPIKAEVSWAACSDKLCIPEKASLRLELIAGSGARSENAGQIKAALAREPKTVGPGAFDVEGRKLLLQVPEGARLVAARARFYPYENGILDASSSRLVSVKPLRFSATLADAAPQALSGVVSDGSSAYRIRFKRAEFIRAAEIVPPASSQAPKTVRRVEPAPAIAGRGAASQPVESDRANADKQWPWTVILAGLAIALALLFALARRVGPDAGT